MTRHAKASSAVPAQRQNTGAARLLLASLAVFALTLALTLAFGASVASAAKSPIFDVGTGGTQGAQFATPRGIAVNQIGAGGVEPGTFYVVDFNNNRIQRFEPDDKGTPDPSDDGAKFISTWGWDVDTDGSADFEVCTVAASCKAGISGGVVGQLNQGGQFREIAGGVAVDPVNGNVSVVDRGNNRVQQFGPTGSFLRAWGRDVDSVNPSTDFEICTVAANCKAGTPSTAVEAIAGQFGSSSAIAGIATDALGNVYVADAAARRIQKFSPTGNFLAMGGWDVDSVNPSLEYEVCTVAANCKIAAASGAGAGRFSTNTPSFLAASPAGDVYAVDATNAKIVRLDSSLALVDAEFAPGVIVTGGALRAIAVDPASGHVFFSKLSDTPGFVYEVDQATELEVAKHPAGAPNWTGLAVWASEERLYASGASVPNVIRALQEGPPIVTTGAATANTGTRATLNGTVNPNGAVVDQCFFEYGPTTAYGQSAPCVSPNAAEVGTGTSPVAVHADITGLAPHGATYHFRLKAVNAKGSGQGADQTLTTPDTVVTTAATAMTNSAATLNGTVNPDTVVITDCVFEYGTTTAYGQSAPCDPNAAGIGSGTSPVAVEADLSGLDVATTYHFRLKATNDDGFVLIGDDLTLQTLGPRIVGTWSEEVALEEAVLKAEIDPEGAATTYRFEWGLAPCSANPCTQVPVPDGPVGSDSTSHELTRFLEGLEPGTTYHYRVVATNAAAENEGPDRTFTTFTRLDPETECSNQDVRIGASVFLPDCRAYEMVSPINKNGGDIETAEQEAGEGSHYSSAYRQASIHGGKVTYSSSTAFGDALGGHWSNQYLSTRGEAGWSTHSISSRRGQTVVEPILFIHRWYSYPFFGGFTPDLSSAWIRDDNVDPLTPDALQGYVNLYRRDNLADSYEALTTQGPFGPNSVSTLSKDVNADLGGPRVVGYSTDLRHQVFTANAALTPDANQAKAGPSDPGTSIQLYDLVDGELHLVSVLPNGQASPHNSFAGTMGSVRLVETRQQMLKNAVSDDGSRIVWSTSAGGFAGAIYIRENPGAEQSASGACDEPGKACTKHVAGAITPSSAEAQFWAASADGSKVLYSLGSHPNRTLHLFDVDAETTTQIAGQSLGVAATSEDLSHVYFVSTEALAPGAIAGQNNLYDYHDGTNSLVGVLSVDDVAEVGKLFGGTDARSSSIIGGASSHPIHNQTRVTPDGTHFAFMSNSAALSEEVAGYDNADAVTGKPDFEVYRYDAEAEELACVSCNPSGQRPRGALLKAPYSPLELELDNHPDLRAAASIPTHEHDNYASRILSDNGNRLFFHSGEALLPRDSNGVQDVYQWQALGTGSCDAEDTDYYAQNDGCLYLISSGRDGSKSEFVDADPTGDEVFFSTDESLDPRDPGLRDIYVAKAGGGFAIPQATAGCEGEACQTPPAPPSDPTPNSLSFQGPGNPPQGKPSKPRCPKGKRRVKARSGKTRCVKRGNAKRAKRANNDRRASR